MMLMIIMMMTITMMLLIAKDKIQFSPTTQSILDHWISWRHWSTETTYTKVNLFAFVSRLGMYFAKTSESTLEKGCLFWYLCWLIQVHHSPKNATGIGSNWGAWNGNASTVFFFRILVDQCYHRSIKSLIQIDPNIWNRNQTLSFSFANSIWTTCGVIWVSLFCIPRNR